MESIFLVTAFFRMRLNVKSETRMLKHSTTEYRKNIPMDNKFQTRTHRLLDEFYQGLITVAFTCCLKDKKQDIAKKEIVLPCSEILFTESIRSDEETDKHMRYILENPIRKGIIEDWKEYPWKGSMVFDLNEWSPL
jgi:hypothetical protein